MSISTQQIGSHSVINAYNKQNQRNDIAINDNSVDKVNNIEVEKTAVQAASELNDKERATLHALFGTEKPSEMTFYGNTQLQHIHKGQLIDVKG